MKKLEDLTFAECFEKKARGHGRTLIRTAYVTDDVSWMMPGERQWPNLLLDVHFDEDSCRVQSKNLQQNLKDTLINCKEII